MESVERHSVTLYLALGNIALVFAAQVCRDSEIAGIPIRIYYGIAIRIGYGISIARDSLSRSLSSRLIVMHSVNCALFVCLIVLDSTLQAGRGKMPRLPTLGGISIAREKLSESRIFTD